MSDNTTDVISKLNNAFEEFKSANDQRWAAIEAKGTADVVLTEKVDRINEVVSDLQRKAARPSFDGVEIDQDQIEHKQAFERFVRRGDDHGLAEVERKAMSVAGDGTQGGFALPKVVEAGVYAGLETLSPVRQLANVITVSGDDYRILANQHGLVTGWVGETDARPETNTPTLAEIKATMGEIYTNPAVSQRALDDLSFDVESFIATETARGIAIAENAAFVNGDGVNKPAGLMTATGVTTVKSGNASTLGTSPDFINAMVYGLPAAYRQNAVWTMASTSELAVRSFKDSTGNYMWQPSLVAGRPASLAGYPLFNIEDMDAVAANKLPVAFGDWKQGFTIVDRVGIRTLRDPFSKKPYVMFYSTKRVGSLFRDKAAFVFGKVST